VKILLELFRLQKLAIANDTPAIQDSSEKFVPLQIICESAAHLGVYTLFQVAPRCKSAGSEAHHNTETLVRKAIQIHTLNTDQSDFLFRVGRRRRGTPSSFGIFRQRVVYSLFMVCLGFWRECASLVTIASFKLGERNRIQWDSLMCSDCLSDKDLARQFGRVPLFWEHYLSF
jgi:hypothetical protein